MTPDEIEANEGAAVRQIEESVMDENQKVENGAAELVENMNEEQKSYNAVTGWPPI